MVNHRRAVMMLVLLLITSFSPALMPDDSQELLETLELEEVDFSEHQRLDIATMNWHKADSMGLSGIEINSYSNQIHLASGSFDPLTSEGPKVVGHLNDELDYLKTGFAILQLETGTSLEKLQEKYSFTILDNLAGGSSMIRLSSNTVQTFNQINNDESVRWLGNMHPGWRVSDEVLVTESTYNLMLIPSNDLQIGGFEKLVFDLTSYGADDAWCGIGACQVSVSDINLVDFIHRTSKDGRIIWIEQGYGLELHNAVAGAISGVVNVASSASFTLDGSGEMLAITDTGLDRDHPDISG